MKTICVKWVCAVSSLLLSLSAVAAEWSSAGQNIANTRYQPAESRISPVTAPRLSVKWVASLWGAAIVDGVVYWGSGYGLWGGRSNNRLFAFEPKQVVSD